MADIAGLSVTVWKGMMTAAFSYEYQLFDQAAVAGHGVVFGAYKAEPVVIETIVRVVGDGGYVAMAAAYVALRKTAVTVNDQFGHTWANTLVLNVQTFESSDAQSYITTARWLFLPASS